MHLMRDRGALFGRFAAADFCGRGLKENGVIEFIAVGDRVGRRARRGQGCGGLAGQLREIVLHRLEFRDLLFECNALVGVAHADVEHGFKAAGDLQAARYGAHQHQRC